MVIVGLISRCARGLDSNTACQRFSDINVIRKYCNQIGLFRASASLGLDSSTM